MLIVREASASIGTIRKVVMAKRYSEFNVFSSCKKCLTPLKKFSLKTYSKCAVSWAPKIRIAI